MCKESIMRQGILLSRSRAKEYNEKDAKISDLKRQLANGILLGVYIRQNRWVAQFGFGEIELSFQLTPNKHVEEAVGQASEPVSNILRVEQALDFTPLLTPVETVETQTQADIRPCFGRKWEHPKL